LADERPPESFVMSFAQSLWRWGRHGVAGLLAVSLAFAAAGAGASTAFTEWSESFAADWIRLSPERATFSQYFTGEEQAAFDRQLTPLTPAQRERRAVLARAGLARLNAFEPASLTPDERVGAATLRWSLQRTLAELPFEDHNFVFSQLGGAHLRYVNLLAENQTLRKASDVGAFLSRLAHVELRLDEAIARRDGAGEDPVQHDRHTEGAFPLLTHAGAGLAPGPGQGGSGGVRARGDEHEPRPRAPGGRPGAVAGVLALQ
jgi:uncharacterized protein (DUF885 family)